MKLNKTYLVMGIGILLGLFLVLPQNLLAGSWALEKAVDQGYVILAEGDDAESQETMEGEYEEQEQGMEQESEEGALGSDEESEGEMPSDEESEDVGERGGE